MGVAVNRQPIRAKIRDMIKRPAKAVWRLVGQPVQQIHVQTAQTRIAQELRNGLRLLKRLRAMTIWTA